MDTSTVPSTEMPNVTKQTTEESDVFSSRGPLLEPYSSKSNRRRASLEVDHAIKASVCFDRRSSVGTLPPLNLSRRLSLGEEGLKLSFTSSSSSINDAQLRRRSLDTCSGVYDPRRRSSLGAESLIEYDLEEENESSLDLRTDIPSDALLGLQYADDVFAVKRDLEVKYHPRKCLDGQPQVTEPVRCAIVNWLVKINGKLNFGAETVFLAVHLLDRFLAASAIASDCVQLLAVCSLFVAAKMEEIKVPGMSALARLCSTPYQKHHLRRMEMLLLTKLGFYLHAPTSWYFINHLALKACQLGYLDRRVTRAARRVAELCLCQYDISQYLPSVQAAASFLSAVSVLEPELGQMLPRLLD
ncbi:Cyclin C-terminal domain, partial [Trinorchestia longiramus]